MPRDMLSENQLELILWSERARGYKDVPSLKTLKAQDQLLHQHCGVDSIRYKGPLGNIYYVNSIPDLIAQVGRYLISCSTVQY